MTAAHAFYLAVIGAVVLSMLLTLGLCAAAGKPRPKPPADPWDAYFSGADFPTLADRMEAARDWPTAAVDAAFAEIVKENSR